jgi:hypothetical protein
VRVAAWLGHRVSMTSRREDQLYTTVIGVDAARWLPEQDRYGHTFHIRQAVSDQMLALSRDDMLGEIWYRTVRVAFTECQIWDEVCDAFVPC